MILPLTNERIKALTNQNFIASFLQCSREELKLLKNDNMYNVFTTQPKNKRPRKIQEPKARLKTVQKIIQKELAREELPDWVMCARGKGHIKNALAHAGEDKYVLKSDISSFYRSCQAKYIYKFFHHRDGYGLNKGVSTTLTQIVTYRGFLPTGSPTSPYLAFLAYRQCFDEIYRITAAHKFQMTLFADDITMSFYQDSLRSSNWILKRIKDILQRYDLCLNTSKTKFYKKGQVKNITGIPVDGNNLLVPNKILKKIHDEFHNGKRDDDRKLNGLNNYAKTIMDASYQIQNNDGKPIMNQQTMKE